MRAVVLLFALAALAACAHSAVEAPDPAPIDGCVCELEWARIASPDQSPIVCQPRGECPASAVCSPVLPLTDDPRCARSDSNADMRFP